MISRTNRWLLVLSSLSFAMAAPALAQTGSVAGRITDAGTSQPLANARVRATAGDGRAAADAYSDEGGQYRLRNLSPGTYVLTVSRIGFAPRSIPDVRVEAGQTTSISTGLSAVSVELNPTIVTASRRVEKALDAPASVVVIDTREIEERPTLSTTEHVRAAPGVDVASTGLLQSTVVARGFSNVFSGALLTLTDNRYASVPSLRVNANYLVPIANEDLERVEVVLGPGAALYGPNSANGVLHMITKSPFESRGTIVSLGGGERDVIRGAVRHAGVAGERFGYKVSAQYLRGRDWEHTDPVEQAARAGAGANPGLIGLRDYDIERTTGELRLDFRPTAGSEIVASGGTAMAGSAIEMTGLGAAQAKDWRYDYVQLRGRTGRLFAQVFGNFSNAGDTYLLRTGQRIRDESRMLVGQVQHSASVGETQTFTYGVDLQRTDPRTFGTINGRNEEDDEINEIGGYVHSSTRLSRTFELVTALRLDHHDRLDDPVLSPRAGLVFRPVEAQNLRLTYNRAFSTPTSNNLFLDVVAVPTLGGLPFAVRAQGVPEGGFAFQRNCVGGLDNFCMRAPTAFGAPNSFIPADATLMWQAIAQVVFAASGGQLDFRGIPKPTSAQVGSLLRTLNATTGTFTPTTTADIRDVPTLEPTINEVVELGYKGLLADRLLLAVDVYRERRHNFIGPLIVETPNVFLNPQQTAAYLISQGFPPARAPAAAAAATQVPAGTITPANPLGATQDLLLTYRNFGTVDLWGGDLSAEAILTDRVTLAGAYSYVSDDLFPKSEVGGPSDIALNAPRNKGSLGVRYRDEGRGLSLGARGRHVAAFPMNSGVYVGEVESYSLLDLSAAYRFPFAPGMMLSVDAMNVLDDKHQEFVGAPAIGRLVLAQLRYSF